MKTVGGSGSILAVRAMGRRDLERVMEIAGALARAPHWKREAFEAAIDPDAPVPRIALVAETCGTVHGFLVATVVAGMAELESIAVEAQAQHQGVGRALILALVGALRVAGVGAVELEVRESNLTARRVYRRAGFVEVGRRRGYYSGPKEDAVLLRMELGQAAGGPVSDSAG